MMNPDRPAAYVRKSHKEAASADAQLAAIREMAIRQGVTSELAVYRDVGVSGRHGQRGAKSDWQRLCDDIEAGKVTLVYVTALDRAGRSLREWLDFTELCVKRGVEVRDQSGQDRASGDAEDVAIVEMMIAQREGRKAVERSARGRATQKRRGDEVYQGHPGYGRMRIRVDDAGNRVEAPAGRIIEVDNPDEPIQPLLDAVADTRGNILQAARVLNAAGVSTRSGRPWDPRVLTRALDRRGVQRRRLAMPAKRRGAPSDAPLSRLVACHCGALMTPARDRRNGQWLELVCAPGRKAGIAAHGRTVARSRHIIDRLRDELAGTTTEQIGPEYDADETAADVAARRAALEDRRRRTGVTYRAGAMDDDEFAQEMDRITDELDALDEIAADLLAGPVITLRTRRVHWEADDETIGHELRQLVRVVKLGEDMRPEKVELRGLAS